MHHTLCLLLLAAVSAAASGSAARFLDLVDRLAEVNLRRFALEADLAAAAVPASEGGLSIRVGPYGVDPSNDTTWEYWKQQPQLHSTVVAVWVAAPTMLQRQDQPPLPLHLAVRNVGDTAQPAFSAAGLEVGHLYTIALGVEAGGEYEFVAHMASASGEPVAAARYTFSVSASPVDSGCAGLFGEQIEAARSTAPVVSVPAEHCAAYTMNGQVPILRWYFDDVSDPEISYQPRGRAHIDALIERASRRQRYGYYGATDDYMFASLDEVRSRAVVCCLPARPAHPANSSPSRACASSSSARRCRGTRPSASRTAHSSA